MNFRAIAARFALVVTCGLLTATPAMAQFWQCAPYARTISGIEIHGNANTWWGQAAGRYARGHAPKTGAVLSFQSIGRMRLGHVAMVSAIVSDREVRLTHANWSRRGRIERDVRAVDVSASGDWSLVKVWFAGNGDLGTTSYPTNGFIYSGTAPQHDARDAIVPELMNPPVTMAPVTMAPVTMAPVTMAPVIMAQAAPLDSVGILSLVDRVAF